jgi:OOP family OmpA-OmpF porin
VNWIVRNKFVKELEGKSLIYFPYNSNKEIRNKEILSYINSLVSQLTNNQSYKIKIVGYTDDRGNPESNIWLGMQRAKRIKNVLIKNGISSDRIITDSKGEEYPLVDNTTKEGRRQNRRVEITIIK